jgi:sugar phosphate isomerase/epimerase
MINKIDRKKFDEMFAPHHLQELHKISVALGGDNSQQIVRFAPSIVTRSELELFGLSSPRFAARFYIDESCRFFINVRRLVEIESSDIRFSKRRVIPDGLRHPRLEFDESRYADPARLIQELQGQTCIADSFLPIPELLADHFEHCSCDLGSAYGESEITYSGSPFMKHINLAGGGLCAQAVCFMATVLHYRHAARVHGLVEITYWATSTEPLPEMPREILINGLSLHEMVTYFERAGLFAIWQRILPMAGGNQVSKVYEQGLRAYLLSKMPVIFTVDCALMDGRFDDYLPLKIRQAPNRFSPLRPNESFYVVNKTALEGKIFEFPFNYHAMIATGVSIDPGGATEFSIHDPLKVPFMKAKAAHLIDSAAWLPRKIANSKEANYHSTAGCFLPVTPPEVKMPLGLWFSTDELKNMDNIDYPCLPGRNGLLYYARHVSGCEDFRHLRLMQTQNFAQILKLCDSPHDFLPMSSHTIDHLKSFLPYMERELVAQLTRGEKHWLWVHCYKNRIWIWDAEIEPPQSTIEAEEAEARFLVMLLEYSGDTWKVHQRSHPNLKSEPLTPQILSEVDFAPSKELRCSLLTSFSVDGVESALTHWPLESEKLPHLGTADLYAFMKQDAERFLRKHLTGTKSQCAVDQMALLAENFQAIEEVAQELHSLFNRRKINIGALATFVPEFTRESIEISQQGRDAFLFLVRLTRQLQQRGHTASVIELVGGSLIDGVWPARDIGDSPESECHGVSLLDWKESLALLVQRMRPIVELIKSTKISTLDLRLALELEPSPLYLLGTPQRAEFLCELLDRAENRDISPYIGLNIDIAHWAFLCEVSTSFFNKKSLFGRIVHAHISDHANGHFCDNAPLQLHKHEDYWPWLKLLEERAVKDKELVKKNYPSFSKYVALELEATKQDSQVHAGYSNLYRLLFLGDTPS